MELSLVPDVLGYIAGFPITNTFWVAVVLSLFLIAVFVIGANTMKPIPGAFQAILETAVAGTHEFIKITTKSDSITRRLFPFVLTILAMFLIGNLMSFLPGLSSITYNGAPFYRTATTDYNLIFIISLFFIIIVQATSIVTGGLFAYIKKFLNFSNPLNFFLGLLDIIGEMAKLISLSFRFFGNAFAAEVLIAVLLFIFPYILPLPFMFLTLLSAIVQPIVFSVLVLIYIQMSVVDQEVSSH